MKKFWIISLLLVFGLTAAFLITPSSSAQKGKFRRSVNGVQNRYIVLLDEKYVDAYAVAPTIQSEAESLTYQFGGDVKEIFSDALKGFVVEMPEKDAIALSTNERVAIVEQDAEISVSSTQGSATWGIDRIDQRSLPLDTQYSYNSNASNVHAYIIDTGIRPTHSEFGGRASADFDALTDGRNGIDCNGHGTHVAGTVGGATYGVAKNVRLHGVRVLPCAGSGLVSHLIMGIDWVAANRILPAVANISITTGGPSTVIDTAIQNAVSAGVTFVVAAGNNNMDACNYSPGRTPAAITVGATYTADDKAGYSNFGSCVDIWAPGSLITSAWLTDDNSTRVMSGTSMASPHVTGVAALYLAAHPTASPATVAQNINSTATAGVVTGLDAASPNRMVYSLLGTAPPVPVAARVTIRKRTSGPVVETTAAEFPFDATNFSASNFTLQPENQIVDPGVTTFGSGHAINVTEGSVFGWTLKSISCVETSGSGFPSVVNSTVDLANRSARIVAEEGEQVECTFTSEQLAPSAANATITGRVVSVKGGGIRNFRLSLLDANTNQMRYVYTNSFGYYTFRDVQVSHLYVLTAQGSKKVINGNNVRTFTLNDNLANVDFVASN
ncbi:MAG TPA: S8 family serine peptidase [Pyrinomonadaceae bacterium]|nr:S8 family serine peptidase [Pyrinomonadaceae bacterium]